MKLTQAQKGASLMVAGVSCMASMDVMAKILGRRILVAQIVWLRFVSQTILVGAGLILTGHTLFLRNHIKLHMLRGFATTTSSYLFFLGIIYMLLADTTALLQLVPVMVTLVAVLVLGEKIGHCRIMGILVAFIGAMLIIRPGTSVMTTTTLFPLMGAVGFTIYALATRFVRNDGPWKTLFLQGFFGMCFSSMIVPFFWQTIALGELPIIVALVTFGILAHLLMIRASAAAPASEIAPYGYAGLLFAIFFRLVLFNETTNSITLLGSIVIMEAGLYVWSREKITQAQENHD